MSNKAMNWATECGVKRAHKLIVMLLADAHNGHTGECFPSQATLVEKSGYSESTVQACLKDLEEWKLIKRETKRLGRGKGSRTNFVLHTHILDPQILEAQNTGFRPPENEGLDPQPTGGEYKDEPEIEPEGTGITPARKVFEFYNQTAERVGWVVHSRLTDALRKPLNARIEEYGADHVMRFIEAMSELDWTWKGFKDNSDFRASLTYITRPRTFAEHFDKLVTSQPEPDLLTDAELLERGWPLDLEGAFNVLERELISGAARPDWIGGRYGYPMDPRCPEADYPAGLYALFPKIQKRESVS
ncbi:MAG: helix-turn-helix domain-containing protein [Hyphomonas sp.]|uniref:helix-turn-helix domain-containing protein n=1 Tax=Hyphomonas sp. TaxID=87 RepID=UPI003264254A